MTRTERDETMRSAVLKAGVPPRELCWWWSVGQKGAVVHARAFPHGRVMVDRLFFAPFNVDDVAEWLRAARRSVA